MDVSTKHLLNNIIALKDGTQYGPFDLAELQVHINSGFFQLTDLCWVQYWSEWRIIASVAKRIPDSTPSVELNTEIVFLNQPQSTPLTVKNNDLSITKSSVNDDARSFSAEQSDDAIVKKSSKRGETCSASIDIGRLSNMAMFGLADQFNRATMAPSHKNLLPTQISNTPIKFTSTIPNHQASPQSDTGSPTKTKSTQGGVGWVSLVTGMASQNTLNSCLPDNGEEELLTCFVGKNYEYYNRKWNLASDPNRIFFWRGRSFNWAACIFTLPWMAYRKMYWAVAFYLGISMLIDLLDARLKIPNVSLWQYVAIPLGMICGWKCNGWYLSSAKMQIKKSVENICDPEQKIRYLKLKGGTSIGICILATLAWVMISIILNLAVEG